MHTYIYMYMLAENICKTNKQYTLTHTHASATPLTCFAPYTSPPKNKKKRTSFQQTQPPSPPPPWDLKKTSLYSSPSVAATRCATSPEAFGTARLLPSGGKTSPRQDQVRNSVQVKARTIHWLNNCFKCLCCSLFAVLLGLGVEFSVQDGHLGWSTRLVEGLPYVRGFQAL